MTEMAFPDFNSTVYNKIGYDELLVFAATSLAHEGAEITFENLVARCFEWFPQRFALRGYPQWPDSAIVNKSWLRCRTDKHYLTGSVKDGFQVTPGGLEAAARTEKILSGQRRQSFVGGKRLSEERTREGRFLRSLEQSAAYRKFREAKDQSAITDFEICDMLLCTLESTPNTRKSNLEFFRHAATTYRRDDVLKFLSSVESMFHHLFQKRTNTGMMSKTAEES